MIDKITMPAIEVTAEEDGTIRFTKTGENACAFRIMNRLSARSILLQLGIEPPPWLHPENDDD